MFIHLPFFAVPLIYLLLLPGQVIGKIANPFSPLTFIGIATLLASVVLLVKAKWPQLQLLNFTTFGVPGLPARNRRMYIASYALLVTGFALVASSGFV